ncbi:MAG: glycoside hydrolase family 88 protein [Ruminococcus sp.]|nr:glycoside hydrolase family 88 protein [Ruminococcus sp.]
MNYEKAAQSYINRIVLPSSPDAPVWNRENQIFRKPKKWNYIDNCMIKAVTDLYKTCGDERLFEYAVDFISAYVDENGDIPTLTVEDYNLDNVNGGKNLLYLYSKTHDERFRKAYRMIYGKQLMHQPRLDCGSFWHKAIYPRQIWLDGAYMALPFMAEYSVTENVPQAMDDVMHQLRNIRDIMCDKNTGLYYHGYDETHSQVWADPESGLSREFWLRSMGWLCAALADIYELTENAETGAMLNELLEAMKKCQCGGGMLLQLPIRKDLSGNYPETSGTLLYAYSAMKAGRLGVCGEDMRHSGEKAFFAVADSFIEEQDVPVLKNICLMAGLGGANNRDGSAEYYLSERRTENDAKGIAPYLMAYNELIRC